MNDKNKIDAFVSFGSAASDYSRQYKEVDYKKAYPANRYRLDILLSLLKKINPKKILDVGCGSGEPLIEMLNAGFDARGFDYAEEMVDYARKNLKQAGYPEDLVHRNNMENIEGIATGRFDCIIAMGSIYYARDFDKTMSNISGLLNKGGRFIFSLRNELFSLFSLNKYSLLFFWHKLMPTELFSKETKQKVYESLSGCFQEQKVTRKFETVDDLNIHSIYHNPLTVESEVLARCNLKSEGLFFYHYHSMPPVLEHVIPEEYRSTSAKIENPCDWRGLFMASAFVVQSCKQ
jgi:SAM-dependent methyltransferase